MIYFSSDFHFNHANIAGPSCSSWQEGFRDFKSLDEMNETLIANINKTVGQDDTLYFLGDLCFKDHTMTPQWRNRINCRNIFWLKGNHDKNIYSYRDYFTWVGDVKMITVGKQKIFLSHYSHRVWEGSHKGYWHLYGHSHDSIEHSPWGKSMDVGVDAAYRILGEYRPFSFDEVKKIMDGRSIAFVDHHNEKTNV